MHYLRINLATVLQQCKNNIRCVFTADDGNKQPGDTILSEPTNMMNFSAFKAFFFLTILALYFVHVVALFPKYKVVIESRLPADSPYFLRLRCQSKDSDLGYHDLKVNETFSWEFRTNFSHSTLFFCHFYWDTMDAIFDVFDEKKLYHQCSGTNDGNLCTWLVKADGFYMAFQRYGIIVTVKMADWKQKTL